MEHAESYAQDKAYEEWARFAMIATTVANVNSKKRHKTSDFIGSPPWEERKKKASQKRVDADRDTLRKLAEDTGLQTNF